MNVPGEDLVPEPTGEAAETDEEAGGTASKGAAATANGGTGSHHERRGYDDRRNGGLCRRRNGRDAGRPDARQRHRQCLFVHGHADAGSTAPANVARMDDTVTVHVIRATPCATAAFTAALIAILDATFISIRVFASVGNNSSEYGAESVALISTVIESNFRARGSRTIFSSEERNFRDKDNECTTTND